MTLSFDTFPPCTSSHYLTNNHNHQYFDYHTFLPTTPHTTRFSYDIDINFAGHQSQYPPFSQTPSHLLYNRPTSQTFEHRPAQLLHPQIDPGSLVATSLPHRPSAYGSTATSDRLFTAAYPSHQMYAAAPNMLGSTTVQQGRSLKRTRSHQRTPSSSTIASNGPKSPFATVAPYTHIVNTDGSPQSPSAFAEHTYAKALPTPLQTPVEAAFPQSSLPHHVAQMSNANLAVRDFVLQQQADSEYPTDMLPSRQSTSSHGNDSPATPQSGPDEYDNRTYNTLQQDVKHSNPNIPLFRSDSQQARQDELFSPYTTYASTSTSKPQSNYLSPHRNLINQRLETANLYRANSPSTNMSRERSPFRDGSLFAPARNWQTAMPSGGSAAQLRQKQKEEAEQAEYARSRPNLQREPTKTISPKDALLDGHESNDYAPLFPTDTLPAGYETHRSGAEQWPNNFHMFGGLPPSSQQDGTYRTATTSGPSYAQADLSFASLPPSSSDQIQGTAFPANYASTMPAPKLDNFDSPPHFPAPLPSMETSNSDAGFGFSSQEDVTSNPQRPADTRANTGAYTCTYHGCTQRYDSQQNLQKHKREAHRAQQTTPAPTESASPPSVDSPGPVGSGMTSAAILARNSQAGPHKCERINPSTGKPCNTVFSRPYDLTRHEDTIHNNRKQKVQCQYCREEKTFSRTDALTRHMRVVHPDVEASGKRGRRGD